ncbi:hypothetical protein M5K25_006845 [Dendrobium thyrsiflorum]|uniref:Uncharacterized protein n=1 Tax=Dendrobium thyrsiflorum TaxID=117978 RepID=A0ABD0VJU5_DENTH
MLAIFRGKWREEQLLAAAVDEERVATTWNWDDHDRNIMVPFGGKPPGSEGPSRNCLPTVPFDDKTIDLWGLVEEALGKGESYLHSQRLSLLLPIKMSQLPLDRKGTSSKERSRSATKEPKKCAKKGRLPSQCASSSVAPDQRS